MISFERFLELVPFEKRLEIFQKKKLSYGDLFRFLKSIKKSVSLCLLYSSMDRQIWDKLLEMDKKYQWPFLSEIDDAQLDIYKRIKNQRQVEKFIKSIKDSKQSSSYPKERIYERVRLYPIIFDFSEGDIQYCKKISERYKKMLERRKKRVRLKCGIAIVGVVGTGIGTYLVGKKLKEKKEIKGKVKGKVVEGKIKKR